MNTEDNQGRTREVREKIVGLMKSIGQAPKKALPNEELQRLKGAISRLDQMLEASAETDRETLRNAASRLDQLLHDISNGTAVIPRLKRPRRAPPP